MPTETNKPKPDHKFATTWAKAVVKLDGDMERETPNLAAAYIDLSGRMERVVAYFANQKEYLESMTLMPRGEGKLEITNKALEILRDEH